MTAYAGCYVDNSDIDSWISDLWLSLPKVCSLHRYIDGYFICGTFNIFFIKNKWHNGEFWDHTECRASVLSFYEEVLQMFAFLLTPNICSGNIQVGTVLDLNF